MTRSTGFILPQGRDVLGRARSALGRVGAIGLSRPTRHTIGKPRILEQHGNSCVGHCLFQQERLWRQANGALGRDVSPYYPYWWARRRAVTDEAFITDMGCQPYHAVRAASKHGLVPLDDWAPWGPRGFGIDTPPPATLRIRAQRVSMTLRPIYATGDAMVERVVDSLAQNRPVMLAVAVDDAFMSDGGSDVIRAPRGSTAGMLHAVTAYGYRAAEGAGYWQVRIANSWGERWRDRGRAWLGHGAVAAARWAGELVSVRRRP